MISPQQVPKIDKSSRQVQIGFKYSLNYPFVASHPAAAAQIFKYLPEGLAQGLNIDEGQVQMAELVPYDTSTNAVSKSKSPSKRDVNGADADAESADVPTGGSTPKDTSFSQTIAKIYIPKDQVVALKVQVSDRSSALYTDQSDPNVKALMSLIDTNVPVSGSYGMSGSGDASGGSSGGGNGGSEDSDENDGDSDDNRSLQGAKGSLDQRTQVSMKQSHASGKIAGITLGTVGGAGMLAAALFLTSLFIKSKLKSPAAFERDAPADMESYHDDTSSVARRWSHIRTGQHQSSPDAAPVAGPSAPGPSSGAGNGQLKSLSPGSSLKGSPEISPPVVTENSLGWM